MNSIKRSSTIKLIIHSERTKEVIRFGIVGVLATIVHYVLYYILQQFININIAYTIGYVLSFLMNFFLTSYFTFRTTPSFKKLIGMSGAHGVNYLLQISLLNVFIFLGVNEVYAPLPVFCIVIPINFLLLRFVFKRKK